MVTSRADFEQTSSRELLVDLSSVSRTRLGVELQRALRAAIRSGRLRAGAALPSTRALAADLGVSRSVVVAAYEQLAAEGYLLTRPGAVARVATVQQVAVAPSPRPTAAGPALAVDFRPGGGDLSSFPRVDWERAVRRALATLPDAALGYGDPRGLPWLREAVADYLGRVRGAIVDPGDLVVTGGFAQALVVVAKLLRSLGVGSVGVEDPGSVTTAGQLGAHGVVTVPVPVDGEGIDVAACPAPPRAVLVTPAHQFPIGVVLSPARRRHLLTWTRAVDGYVIEDDYDAEFRYDHQPVAVIQGLAPDRVLLGGSTSKTLAPALRLGWLAAPPGLAGQAARYKAQIDLMSPVVEQAAFAELLISGAYERHVRRARARYRRRRNHLLDLLASHLPEVRVSGEAAGLHLVVETPSPTSEARVVARAARLGLGLIGVGAYRNTPGPSGFVLSYAHLNHSQLRRAVTTLARALRGQERSRS